MAPKEDLDERGRPTERPRRESLTKNLMSIFTGKSWSSSNQSRSGSQVRVATPPSRPPRDGTPSPTSFRHRNSVSRQNFGDMTVPNSDLYAGGYPRRTSSEDPRVRAQRGDTAEGELERLAPRPGSSSKLVKKLKDEKVLTVPKSHRSTGSSGSNGFRDIIFKPFCSKNPESAKYLTSASDESFYCAKAKVVERGGNFNCNREVTSAPRDPETCQRCGQSGLDHSNGLCGECDKWLRDPKKNHGRIDQWMNTFPLENTPMIHKNAPCGPSGIKAATFSPPAHPPEKEKLLKVPRKPVPLKPQRPSDKDLPEVPPESPDHSIRTRRGNVARKVQIVTPHRRHVSQEGSLEYGSQPVLRPRFRRSSGLPSNQGEGHYQSPEEAAHTLSYKHEQSRERNRRVDLDLFQHQNPQEAAHFMANEHPLTTPPDHRRNGRDASTESIINTLDKAVDEQYQEWKSMGLSGNSPRSNKNVSPVSSVDSIDLYNPPPERPVSPASFENIDPDNPTPEPLAPPQPPRGKPRRLRNTPGPPISYDRYTSRRAPATHFDQMDLRNTMPEPRAAPQSQNGYQRYGYGDMYEEPRELRRKSDSFYWYWDKVFADDGAAGQEEEVVDIAIEL